MELDERPLEIASVVEDSVRLLRDRGAAAGITISFDLPAGLPLILADERRIRQVAINLLANAVKFTPHGGSVRVSASLTPGQGLAVTVADSEPSR